MTTINAVGNGLSGTTGSGSFVGSTSPTLVTPTLGVASANSINFGGSTLSAYTQTGVWTPVFSFATPGDVSVVYTAQVGYYMRIGSVAVISFLVQCTPTYSTSAGAALLTGFPLASNASVNSYGGPLIVANITYPTSVTSPYMEIAAGASNISMYGIGSTLSSPTAFTVTQFPTGTAVTIAGTMTCLL